jgi:hypothetical protein
MPSIIVLLTADPALADSWERQLPAGRTVLRSGSPALTGEASDLAAAVVLDAASERHLPRSLERCPTIYVGEPGSQPFEQARLSGKARVYLSYEQSARCLWDFVPLVEEIAEKQAMLNLLMGRMMRAESARAAAAALPLVAADSPELWDFLGAAIENVDNRDRLVTEFRRAARQLFRASHVIFFFREGDAFRAEQGQLTLPAADPLVGFLERQPAIVDGANWEGAADPKAELAVRNRLTLWGARMFVPVHENGRLIGLIAIGVRDDGQAYDDKDRARAVCFARLLRQFIAKSALVGRLSAASESRALGEKYLPRTLLLGPGEGAPPDAPVAVRDLVGRAARARETLRIAPSEGQPYRASAGVIAETGGTWAVWEEAGADAREAVARLRQDRSELLRDLGLTLAHEFGNALVSLSLLRQLRADQSIPATLLETLRSEIARLESVNRVVGLMQNLHETEPSFVDIRDLARAVGHQRGIRVKVKPEPVMLTVARSLVEFALRALLETVLENRPEGVAQALTLQVRSTGSGADLTALVSIEGKGLELEGIIPEPAAGSVPNQGRLGVLLAKEILRMHNGEIHSGPGMDGPEILVSLRGL